MPSIIDRALSLVGLERKSAYVQGVPLSPMQKFLGFLEIFSGKPDPQTLINENKNWVAACTDAIAKPTAGIELLLWRTTKKGPERVEDHPVLDLLTAVNKFMTRFELMETTAAHLLLYGNSFWLLDGMDKESNKPEAIYPLNPKFLSMKRGGLPEVIQGYEYRVGNVSYTFKPYQIVHIRETNPDDILWGKGKLEKAFDSVLTDNYTRAWSGAFFKNGARVDSWIETPGALTEDQARNILSVWNSRHQGAGRAHKTGIIPLGGSLKETSTSIKDMDFPQLRQVTRDEILAMFGVPKSVLGLVEDVNRANAEASSYQFALLTLKPLMQRITDYLNEFLLPLYGDDSLYFTFRDPVPENRLEELEVVKAGLGNKPFMSVNEARKKYDLPPIENGDDVMTDFTAIPLGAPTAEKAAPASPRTRALTRHAKITKAAEKIADGLFSDAKAHVKSVKASAELDEAEWRKFQVRISPYIKAITAALKKLGSEQEKIVLDNLKDALPRMAIRLETGDVSTKVVDADELFDSDEATASMAKALVPIYNELVKAEGSAVLEQITGAAFDARVARVQKGIEHAVSLLADSYTETTKTKLRDALEEGIAAGEPLDAIAARVEGVYEAIDQTRAYAVALTETNRVGNFAAREAMVQSSVVTELRWYTAEDERVCGYCDELNGKVVGIDEAFYQKGDSAESINVGDMPMVLDYDDTLAPPLHPSCHCYIRPETIQR